MTPRAAAAALVLALCAGTASAQEDAATVRREIELAARAGAHDRAAATLDRLLAPETPRVRARDVEAARAAVELLPWDAAAPRARRLLAEALRQDRTDRDGAWTAAQDLRKRMIRRVDLENGVPFLEELAAIYPDVDAYARDLSDLLLNGGRRDEARRHLERRFRMAPSDTGAAYKLALLAEEDGDLDAAVEWYERILRARPGDLDARRIQVRVLWKKDRAAARRALDDAFAAAEASPSASYRADQVERLREQRRWMDDQERLRANVAAIDRRIGLAMGAALLAWAVVVGLAWAATRPAAPSSPADAGPSR